MRRRALVALKKWADEKHSKPLVLKGARQVGKSTLVRLFCEENKFDLVELNLENIKIKEFENDENFSLTQLLSEIETASKKKLTGKSILFIDEIQEQPKAYKKLRYFYEEAPQLKVIAAGSLLEVVLEKEHLSVPVGRIEYYNLGPMSFTEFLLAKNETLLLEKLSELSHDHPPSETLNEALKKELKDYFFVGGMPEVVKTFIESKDREKVRKIQENLLQTYREDILKYTSKKENSRVREVFDYVPGNRSQTKVTFSDISDTNSRIIKDAIAKLSQARVIIKVINNKCIGLPLKSGEVSDVMKLFFLDIGLANALTGVQWEYLSRADADELLTKGAQAEQFIAQHLAYLNPSPLDRDLSYWLREGGKNQAEVDFIWVHKGKIIPLEVKAGVSGKLKSLWQYAYEKKPKFAVRFDLKHREKLVSQVEHTLTTRTGLEKVKCELIGIPLYAIEGIENFLKAFE